MEWSAGHAPRGGTGLSQLCARFSRPSWRGGVGMGWLRTVRNGVTFVTAPSPLLDPLCLAALNTGIPFLGPLPVTLTLADAASIVIVRTSIGIMREM
eukprot:80333-Chlamydomonas_euryale.AAC.1